MLIYVQFSDSTDTSILSSFGGPQDPDVYANLGTVDSSDPRWLTYYDLFPASAQQYLPTPT